MAGEVSMSVSQVKVDILVDVQLLQASPEGHRVMVRGVHISARSAVFEPRLTASPLRQHPGPDRFSSPSYQSGQFLSSSEQVKVCTVGKRKRDAATTTTTIIACRKLK
jgi:hypothetical protein